MKHKKDNTEGKAINNEKLREPNKELTEFENFTNLTKSLLQVKPSEMNNDVELESEAERGNCKSND